MINATDTEATPDLAETLRKLLRPIASLQLTVALFAMSLVLVFFGTLAQKDAGIWTVVTQYFWSWIVMIDPQLLFTFSHIFFGLPTNVNWSGGFQIPFPAGKLLGSLMFVNLIAAHAVRFRVTWRRAGIFIIHGGILLMFVGEFITRQYTIEQRMPIVEGESANYTSDNRNYELVIITPSGETTEHVVSVPASRLTIDERIVLPAEVPFDLRARTFFPNSEINDISAAADGPGKKPAATHGVGLTAVVKGIPVISGTDTENKEDMPATQVELLNKEKNEVIASYLLPVFFKPQEFSIHDKSFNLALRNTRYYKPYSIHLNKFTFDRYLGTEIPKNFASNITLSDPDKGVEYTTTISMNEPMRYRGETFYQSGVLPGEQGTVLAVVRNPGWMIPYISCAVVTLGLLLHFGIHLREYLRKLLSRKAGSAPIEQTKFERALPWLVLAGTIVLTLLAAMPHGQTGHKGLDLERASRLPVLDGGRVKPLDTVARVSLRQLNHKEFYTSPENGKTRPAIDWWLGAAATEDRSNPESFKAEVFRIENDQVLNLLGLTRREGLRYSAEEISKKYSDLVQAVDKAQRKDSKIRDLFDQKVLELFQKMTTHAAIMTGEGSRLIAPTDGTEWQSLATVQRETIEAAMKEFSRRQGVNLSSQQDLVNFARGLTDEERKAAAAMFQSIVGQIIEANQGHEQWEALYRAYREGDQKKFDEATDALQKLAGNGVSTEDLARVRLEAALNDSALYFWCIGLYVLAFLLTVGAWICYVINPGLGQAWRRSAIFVLLFTFAIHTFTLFARMYLMDRPFVFVTNLYSTAVFIGWAGVGAALVVERLVPITLGCFVASVLGFLTTILAHNLAASGDTLEMMRAVLDTNFWLATHVTTINLGYSATYIAGLIGFVYLIVGIFTPLLKRPLMVTGSKQELGRLIGQILYGAIAGATILSFVGTVLGGIWGDQSWGRFWGWDPKENGALMIVIWNTMILHARWAGLVKDRGMAVLALGGNMITTWSYFGTNQLGVGLHAYGFSNTLAAVCVVMWIVNLILIGVGLIPKQYWRSSQ